MGILFGPRAQGGVRYPRARKGGRGAGERPREGQQRRGVNSPSTCQTVLDYDRPQRPAGDRPTRAAQSSSSTRQSADSKGREKTEGLREGSWSGGTASTTRSCTTGSRGRTATAPGRRDLQPSQFIGVRSQTQSMQKIVVDDGGYLRDESSFRGRGADRIVGALVVPPEGGRAHFRTARSTCCRPSRRSPVWRSRMPACSTDPGQGPGALAVASQHKSQFLANMSHRVVPRT